MKMVVNSVPASTSLLEEIDFVGPNRSRESDGTRGDPAHAQTSSDHNPDETGRTPGEDADSIDEVHARDVTDKGPWLPGWSMERIVQIMLRLARQGLLPGLQNIIYNRRIWSRSWGWTQRDYTGSNPHDKHAHFGFRYGSGSGSGNPENFTGPWGIKAARLKEIEDDMPTVDEILDGFERRFGEPLTATQLGRELAAPTTAVRKGMIDTTYAGVRDFLTDVHRAATNHPLYAELDPASADAKRMRFARDIFAAGVKYALDLNDAEEAVELPEDPPVTPLLAAMEQHDTQADHA